MKYNRKNVVSEKIDDALVLLDHETSRLITLNLTASFIWGLLKKPITEKEIINKVNKTYPDAKKEDVLLCLRSLRSEKLVDVA